MIDRVPCGALPCKLAWDKNHRLTKGQKTIHTPNHPWVNRTITKAFAVLTSSAAAAASAVVREWRRVGTFIAKKLRNYFPPTSNKLQHTISHNIFTAHPVFFMFHIMSGITGFPSPHSFCFWFRRRNSEWSDVPLNCVNRSPVIKRTLLAIYFVSVFQPIDFICKICCSLQYTSFPIYFPSVYQH